jgi:hypothetical protein
MQTISCSKLVELFLHQIQFQANRWQNVCVLEMAHPLLNINRVVQIHSYPYCFMIEILLCTMKHNKMFWDACIQHLLECVTSLREYFQITEVVYKDLVANLRSSSSSRSISALPSGLIVPGSILSQSRSWS